jgi:tRNA(Ile2) C34 agmatinyltransferase TiaS
MNEKEVPKCPRCGSGSPISEIAGAGLRCGQCGHQFNQTKDVIAEAARKRRQAGFVGNWRPQK